MKDEIRLLILHAGWVGYQIAAKQEYNLVPTLEQSASLASMIQRRDKMSLAELTPENEHNEWMKYKLEHGWKWGEAKDEEQMTHPDLVPWDELPEAERRKNIQSIELYKMLREIKD